MVQRSIILVILSAFVITGCQPKSEPSVSVVPKDSSVIIGSYRLKATPDEIAEAGGLENLPQLIIQSDHFRLVIDKTESSGIWKYESGIVSLSDKETGETTKFKADPTGTELTEVAEDPITFAKFGVEPLPNKPE
ncbi:MAG: hypothetical protein ACKVQS_14250 [Fimbriimonadaceae bacterium]